jgi:aminocarboxymuconate-semialdehyde decarboxylase
MHLALLRRPCLPSPRGCRCFASPVATPPGHSSFHPFSVDVHSHVYLPRYMDMLRLRAASRAIPYVVPRAGSSATGGQPTAERMIILPGEDAEKSTTAGRPLGPEYYDMARKLAFMDRHAIRASVVSLANPWLDFLPREEAVRAALQLNQDLQAVCESKETRGRLYGFGVLPFQDAEACVAELHRISSYSRLCGVIMGTAGLGRGLDDPALHSVWAAAEKLGLTIFLHPHYGVGIEHFGGHGHSLFLALGFPFETATAVARLVLSGAFDCFPELRLLLAHAGGVLPFLAGRLDSCVAHDPAVAGRLQRAPSDYLRCLYYDALVYHEPAVRCAIEFVGVDRLMFGTDHPFFPPLGSDDGVDDFKIWPSAASNYQVLKGCSQAEVDGICRNNAARILNLKL